MYGPRRPPDAIDDEDAGGHGFPDYLVPGIVLFTFVGVSPILVAYGLLRRPAWRLSEAINSTKGRHWAWAGSWVAGLITLIWIGAETSLLGYIRFLQPVIAIYGTALIILTLTRRARDYYAR